MNFFIHCLLISGIFALANATDDIIPSILAQNIKDDFEHGGSNVTGSSEHKLTLVAGEELGRSPRSLVWRGIYNDEVDVAVKIFMDQKSMDKEMIVYTALNATEDAKIENHHIPRVYYCGPFLGKYYAIAMSRFDGILFDYYTKRNGKHLSDADILYVLMQAVKGLEYLGTKNVVHNDIKPQNLFYRGRDVFIGDFDVATINGQQNRGCTRLFASASFFANASRSAKDDLESLIYSIWFLAGVPLDEIENEKSMLPPKIRRPEGQTFYENLKQGTRYARSQLMIKCKHFKNNSVRHAFKDIIDQEFFSKEPIPNYEGIIQTLIIAINGIDKRQRSSKWLSDGLCYIFTLCQK